MLHLALSVWSLPCYTSIKKRPTSLQLYKLALSQWFFSLIFPSVFFPGQRGSKIGKGSRASEAAALCWPLMAVTHKICTQMVRSASRFGGNGKGFPMIWFNAVAASPPFKKSLVITLQRWLQSTLQNSHVRSSSDAKESSNQQNTSKRRQFIEKLLNEKGHCCSYLWFQDFCE